MTTEFQARGATFPGREIRAETTMNPDTTQSVRTFHAVRSKQMSERLHKETQGQNLTTETPEDLEHKEPGSICYPGEEFKAQGISLARKPPDSKIVTSKPPNCSGEVNTIAVLDNVDDLCIRPFSMNDDVVQT